MARVRHHTAKRLAILALAAVLMAFNMNTFVRAGSLVPGGFTGLAVLIREAARRFTGANVPFSVILITLNAVPAAISFRFIGKRYSLFSCAEIVLCGLLTDWFPPMFTGVLQFQDTLLSAVFGGILSAASTSLCLYAGATGGGTDFIAIFISERYNKDAWHYIFAGNCVILALAGTLYDIDKVLYSIIFQFTTTMALNKLYRGYRQATLLIITDKPADIYTLISERTHHDATSFPVTGRYLMAEHTMLYSVVSEAQSRDIAHAIKQTDPAAFVNVLKTERLNGRFYRPPKD